MITDSNILIYASKPEYRAIRQFIRRNVRSASAISRVEVLGFHRFTPNDQQVLEALFTKLEIWQVTHDIIEGAVRLRQQRKMSLGDAIIAATALEHGLPLVTRNVDDFRWIPDLVVINPFEPEEPEGQSENPAP